MPPRRRRDTETVDAAETPCRRGAAATRRRGPATPRSCRGAHRPLVPAQAFNLACCHAQCGRLDESESWLRRAIAWGVRGVDLLLDAHLAPLREKDYALLVNLSEATRPPEPRQLAVLQRSRRARSGGAMAALIRQEKKRQEMEAAEAGDDDVADFWKDEADDDERVRRADLPLMDRGGAAAARRGYSAEPSRGMFHRDESRRRRGRVT